MNKLQCSIKLKVEWLEKAFDQNAKGQMCGFSFVYILYVFSKFVLLVCNIDTNSQKYYFVLVLKLDSQELQIWVLSFINDIGM